LRDREGSKALPDCRGGRNLGLLMRKVFAVGTPKGLQGEGSLFLLFVLPGFTFVRSPPLVLESSIINRLLHMLMQQQSDKEINCVFDHFFNGLLTPGQWSFAKQYNVCAYLKLNSQIVLNNTDNVLAAGSIIINQMVGILALSFHEPFDVPANIHFAEEFESLRGDISWTVRFGTLAHRLGLHQPPQRVQRPEVDSQFRMPIRSGSC